MTNYERTWAAGSGVHKQLTFNLETGYEPVRVICKRAFQFVDWLIEETNGEKMAKAKRTFIVRPSAYPQDVPDWIAADELFDIARRDGNLTVVDSRSK